MHEQPKWLLVASVFAALAVTPCAALAQSIEGSMRSLTEIEADTQQLTTMPLRRSEQRSPTYVEERLADGELFFRLQDYVSASVILTDIVENHAQHRAVPDALFLLGESLYKAGDYLGARSRYRAIIEKADLPSYRPFVQRALGRLIEIAIHTSNFDGVDEYFARLSRLPPSEVESATNYFRAKYLYSIALRNAEDLELNVDRAKLTTEPLEQARLAFEAVGERSPYYPQARYFIGVIHVLRGQLGPAVDAFRRVSRLKATTDAHRRIVDLSFLAMGRIHYEFSHVEHAIEAYQAVHRTSPLFDTALYEIAWVYIRMGDATRAERALEVLSVAVPDSRHIPDGKLLRGNLLLRSGRFDDASGVFEDVTEQFGPVRDELNALVATRESPEAYFQELVRNNLDSFDAEAFLPPLALQWASSEGEMGRAMSSLADMAQARQLTQETESIVARLRGALGGGDPVNVFRDLRIQREQTTAIKNRVEKVRADLLAVDARAVAGFASPELTAVRTKRREVEAQLGSAPQEAEQLQRRAQDGVRAYLLLDKELSRAKVEMLGIEAQITATDLFLQQTSTARDPNATAAVKAELATQRGALTTYRDQVKQLSIDIEAARLHVGVGDELAQREEALRKEHEQLVAQERALLKQLNAPVDARVDAGLGRAQGAQAKLDARDAEIDSIVAERVAHMNAVLDEESQKLVGYRARLGELEQDAIIVVGGVAYANYRKVQRRFYDLVLRADVGIVDVAWAIREQHRLNAERLTRDRARSLKALADEYRDITDEAESPE
jgi:TolA-binding protein